MDNTRNYLQVLVLKGVKEEQGVRRESFTFILHPLWLFEFYHKYWLLLE